MTTKTPLCLLSKKDMSIETITLEEALELFKLPRTLGEYEGKTVTVNAGPLRTLHL